VLVTKFSVIVQRAIVELPETQSQTPPPRASPEEDVVEFPLNKIVE